MTRFTTSSPSTSRSATATGAYAAWIARCDALPRA